MICRPIKIIFTWKFSSQKDIFTTQASYTTFPNCNYIQVIKYHLMNEACYIYCVLFEDILQSIRKTTTVYKHLLQTYSYISWYTDIGNGWSTCLVDVTAFSCNDGFKTVTGSLACTHHIVCIDIEYYSCNGSFQVSYRIVGTFIGFSLKNCPHVIFKGIQLTRLARYACKNITPSNLGSPLLCD